MSWITNQWKRIRGRITSTPSNAGSLEEVCVFPLNNMVLIPGVVLPLHIFEERYKLMADEVLKNDGLLAMSWSNKDAEMPLKPNTICGAGHLSLIDKFPDGRANVLIEGQMRLEIMEVIQDKPFIRAKAKMIPDVPFENQKIEDECYLEIKRLAQRYVFLSDEFPDEYLRFINIFHKPHYLADFVGYYFLPTAQEKQKHLETLSRRQRVEKIISFLSDQVQSLEQNAILSDKTINSIKVWH